ncbi:polysaccharide deacetylase family protein [Candidatus Peregrinibacteria bacterium]|nr:polysaccharide deacetylase family protein [Candidatus Peregrinibacteria bacterium]
MRYIFIQSFLPHSNSYLMKRSLFILGLFTLCVVINSFFLIHPSANTPASLVESDQPVYQESIYDDEQYEEYDGRAEKIAVLEYHNFGEEDGRWTRSPESFYNDLLWLYNNDYRPVTVEQFLNMKFPIEEGKKPILLTFDDASEGQFRILEDGTIDPDCAVGVMNRFIEERPDFGSAGTFFVLPYSFGQAEYIDDKLQYLVSSGREIGSHTFGHEDLDKVDAQTIQWTLAEAQRYVNNQLDLDEPYEMRALAYPLGNYPDGELLKLIESGEDEGYTYEIDAAFLVGSHPAFMPNHEDFDPYMIPRIQVINEEWDRWFNRAPGEIEKSDEDPAFRPYVAHAQSVVEPEEVDVAMEIPVEADDATEGEIVDEEGEEEVVPEFPYQTCKPTTVQRASFGSQFWKAIAYKLTKVQVNMVPDSLVLRDGKFYYTIPKEGGSVSKMFLPYSNHYRTSKFREALLAANPDSDFEPGDEVMVPDIPRLLIKHSVPANQPWGIYLTGYYAVSDEGNRLAEAMQKRGGKMLVFDVKEIDGKVFYPSEVPMVSETGADSHVIIPDLENYVRYWHDQGIYLAARIVIFKDINLARSRPDLAIQHVHGGPWSNREGVMWVDPSNEETQEYILGLTEELAQAGVDEIQFDYIRFPTLGPVNETRYNFDEANTEKYEVIRDFIVKVHDRIRPYESKLSLDVYGVIAWNDGYDARSTGQRMECLGPYIDVVYPMVYPSHFGPGFAGFDKPGDHPYYFVDESIRLFQELLVETDTEIRPWIQAFAWGVSDYGWWYVEEQIKAANDRGVKGYALWNASNRYF